MYRQTVAAGSGLSRNKSLNQQQGWILRENRPTLCSKKDVVSRSGPSREKVLRKRPQSFPEHKLKIIFPLNMPRANAAGIPNHFVCAPCRTSSMNTFICGVTHLSRW